MKIEIVTIGKITLKTLTPLVEEYLKRLQYRFPITIKNFKNVGDVLSTISRETFLVVLDTSGRSFSSEKFAVWLGEQSRFQKKMTFLVGPAEGLPKALKAEAPFLLSLSPFTLQHELALVVLLEQLYRASTILKGEPYHK